MRTLLTALVFFCVIATQPQAQSAPRLVVVVVVDQFRADYLTTFASHWRAGFKTISSEGAVFTQAAYPYFYTDTCAGHFTIGTGTLPRTHGMVADTWWEPSLKRTIECTDDDEATNVSYGRGTKVGKSAKWSKAPTLADQLRSQRPGARVVSLSLKPRGAIGLAGERGDAVTWFEETAGVMSFMTSKAFATEPVPAVKSFLERDKFDTDIGRTWTLRDPANTYRNRDAGLGERPPAPWTGLFPHDIKSAAPPAGAKPNPDQALGLWRQSPFADAYLGRMAIALIDAFDLGRDETTDFLGVSFSAVDYVGHAFGPDSRELEDTVARMDDTLGALIAHLDTRVGRQNYVLALSADHGAPSAPAVRGASRVPTEDVRERIEDTLTTHWGPAPGERYITAGSTFLKLADGVAARLQQEPAVLRRLQEEVTSIPGIARLLVTAQMSETSKDPIERAAALSRFPGRNGELIVVAKPDWQFLGRNAATASMHGSPYDYDQRVPIVLLGAGIRPGRYPNAATPADIAPTLARLANVQMSKVEGRVLKEALR
jgi:predicted AlkP superfamily pyrophosphatase or phosphodiesterase